MPVIPNGHRDSLMRELQQKILDEHPPESTESLNDRESARDVPVVSLVA